MYKIYNGSKSTFAYVLLIFTFGYGLDYTLVFLEQSVMAKSIQINGLTQVYANFYILETVDFFYFLLSLQCWIFALKYLESAVNCSFTTTCLTNDFVNYTLWAGIGIYLASHTTCYVWDIVTCPGLVNNGSFDEFNAWYLTTGEKIEIVTNMLWTIFNIVSTFIAIFAMIKIFNTVRQLKKMNSTFKINKRTMIAHIALMILMTLFAILRVLP